MTNHQIAEVAHWMALGPLAVLGGMHVTGRKRDRGYWLLAMAFAISWAADTAAHWVDPLIVSVVYLGSQAGLVAVTLLPRVAAAGVVIFLTLTGFAALSIQPDHRFDLLQHTVAWLLVGVIMLPSPELGAIRWALAVGFLAMLAGWFAYVANWPSVTAWYGFQGARLFAMTLFSAAVWKGQPSLRLA